MTCFAQLYWLSIYSVLFTLSRVHDQFHLAVLAHIGLKSQIFFTLLSFIALTVEFMEKLYGSRN